MRYLPRFRFSLRTLLIVTVIVAILAGEFTRRLWRYQDRRAALATLETYGFRFTTDASQVKPAEKDPLGALPCDWLDAWLFGDEVCVGCYKAEFNTQEYFVVIMTQPVPDFAKLLAPFPEIEELHITTNHAHKWPAAGLDSLRHAMETLASRPHLVDFQLELPYEIGHEWITKITPGRKIRVFFWEEKLPPEAVSTLLKRAPEIEDLHVYLTDLSDELVQRLNNNPNWQYNAAGKAAGKFWTLLSMPPDSLARIERLLNQVQVNLHFVLWVEEYNNPELKLQLDGSGLASIMCSNIEVVEFKNLAHCFSAWVNYKTHTCRIENCPHIPEHQLKEIEDRVISHSRKRISGGQSLMPQQSP